MTITSVLVAFSALVIAYTNVLAFPSQAGSCAARGNALGGPHLYNSQVGGTSLSDFGLEVRLDGSRLVTGTQVTVGTRYSLELVSTLQGNTFRGFLIRLESPGIDTTAVLSPPPNANDIQVSTAMCVHIEGVGGLTHTGRDDKTSVKGYLQIDEEAPGLYLEVTVVVQNSAGVSEWYYSEFNLEAVPVPPPTNAPVAPTPKPTSTPTNPPFLSPTRQPNRKPTNAPTSSPTTKQPTSTSTQSPTPFPTPKPVTPTSRPTVTITASPTKLPRPVPSAQPTSSPTRKFTTRPTPEAHVSPPTRSMPTVEPFFVSELPSWSDSLTTDFPTNVGTVIGDDGFGYVSLEPSSPSADAPSMSPSSTLSLAPLKSPSSAPLQDPVGQPTATSPTVINALEKDSSAAARRPNQTSWTQQLSVALATLWLLAMLL